MKLPGVQAVPKYGGFGQAMMEKLGWSKGKGLGREMQGMSEAITVVKKDDQLGVGGEGETYAWGEKWWESVYDSCANLNAIGDQSDDDNEDAAKGKKRSKRKRKGGDESSDRSDSDSSEDSDDDEMRAKLKAVMGVGRDGISCTATADEQRIAQRMAKDSWGRWGGREGKMARIRAAEAEFMAKHHPGAAKEAAAKQAAADAAVEAAKATKESGSASSSKERKKQAKKSKGEKVKKVKMSGAAAAEAAIEPVKGFVCHAAVQAVAQRQARGGDGGAGVGGGGEGGGGLGLGRRAMAAMTAMTAAMSKALPTPASWWGAKVFVSAGLLGEQLEERAAQAEAKVAAKKRGFTEGDQESLFNLTHDGKSSGKKGLGRGQPGALNLGSDYTGKKFAFEEAAEEGGAEKEDNRGEGSSGGGGGGSGSAEVEALKWKKEMRKALEEAPGRSLSVKRLQKAVLAALAGKSSASTKQLKAAFKEKLEGSSMFRVDGDEVALVSKSDHGGASKSKPGKKTKR